MLKLSCGIPLELLALGPLLREVPGQDAKQLEKLSCHIGRAVLHYFSDKGQRAADRKVKAQMGLVIFGVVLVVLLVVAPLVGCDSRDGNDWSRHPRA